MRDILTVNILIENKERFEFNNPGFNADVVINGAVINVSYDGRGYKAYKEILEKTDSEYVVFFNDENIITADYIRKIISALLGKNDDIYSLRHPDEEYLEKNVYMTGGVGRNPFYLGRYICKTEFLKKVKISSDEEAFYDDKIVLSITKNVSKIPMLGNIKIQTVEPMEMNINVYRKPYEYDWYIPYFREFVIPFLNENKGRLTPTEQRLIMWMIAMRLLTNHNNRNKFVLLDEKIDEFFEIIREVLEKIDDEFIIEIKTRQSVPVLFSYLLLQHKYSEPLRFTTERETKKRLIYYTDKGLVYGANLVRPRIKAINWEKEGLVIDGVIAGDYCMQNPKEDFYIRVNGKNIDWKTTNVYNLDRIFGKSVYRYTAFQFIVPREMLKAKCEISFRARVGEQLVVPTVNFVGKPSSRIARSRWIGWRFDDKMLTYSNESLIVDKYSTARAFVMELGRISKIIRSTRRLSYKLTALYLRPLYRLTMPKYKKKPVWLFFDKLYKAGDNGDYLFRYCMENNPEADCYYLLNKTASEYKDMKRKYGKHILEFGSLRQKLVALHSDMIYATHAGVWSFCGFNKVQSFYKEFLDAKVVCIQHGLTTQSIAEHQNRLEDNTRLYFCASKYEIENLEHSIYGYENDELKLTGCPRYDGLKNNDKKQILITPTWRRNIVITGNDFGTSKDYNEEFKHTKYFEIYNSLINDERLIEASKKTGYRLVYLIHPTLSSQLDDFDKNDYVDIIPAVSDMSYEKILTESSLMLTDYSGVQFDFAYMKKPLIYYQPKELPPQYEEGVYKYSTMGFGPIIDDYDEVVKTLCEYMNNGCKMNDMYQKRVDDFFEYTDYDNCKRIMKVIEDESII